METYIENVKNAIQPSRLSFQSLYPSDWVDWSATKGKRPAIAASRAVETNSHLVAARAHQATFIGYDATRFLLFRAGGPCRTSVERAALPEATRNLVWQANK